jgi:hypothetical protein
LRPPLGATVLTPPRGFGDPTSIGGRLRHQGDFRISLTVAFLLDFLVEGAFGGVVDCGSDEKKRMLRRAVEEVTLA